MAQTKAQKKRAIEGKKYDGLSKSEFTSFKKWCINFDLLSKFMKTGDKKCQSCGGAGQTFRNRSEMESGEGVKCKKCRGNGY